MFSAHRTQAEYRQIKERIYHGKKEQIDLI